jgi:hypothetical protein
MSETNHCSREQRHDHSAVFKVVSCPKGVVPLIKQFRDMAPDAKGQDQNGAEMDDSPPHVYWMRFWHACLKKT